MIWTGIVLINSVVCFIFAFSEYKHFNEHLGIVLGVITFIGIYLWLDYYLYQHQYLILRKHLLISSILKASTQFFIVIEMLAGSMAINLVSLVTAKYGMLHTYLVTLVTGFELSIIVALLLSLIHLGAKALNPQGQ